MKKRVLLLLVVVFAVLCSVTAFAGVEPSPFNITQPPVIITQPPVIVIQVSPKNHPGKQAVPFPIGTACISASV